MSPVGVAALRDASRCPDLGVTGAGIALVLQGTAALAMVGRRGPCRHGWRRALWPGSLAAPP